jgi:hypothetical protein
VDAQPALAGALRAGQVVELGVADESVVAGLLVHQAGDGEVHGDPPRCGQATPLDYPANPRPRPDGTYSGLLAAINPATKRIMLELVLAPQHT